MLRFFLLLVLLLVPHRTTAGEPAAFAQAKYENWHHWRGPLATGVAPKADPPIRWDTNTNIRWKAPLPGRGSATPIIWGETVFVVTAIKTDRKAKPDELPKVHSTLDKKTDPPDHFYQFDVLAFERDSGKLRWRQTAATKVPHEGHHASHSYAAGSPTTDGQRLYVSFGSFGIFCYDFDGKLLWQRDFGRLSTRYGWGEAVTPVLHGDLLLLNWDQEADSSLICLDARTGETKWRTKRDEKSSWNTPLVLETKSGPQVILNGTNRVRGYDLATGNEVWQVGGMTINAIPSPVAADGIVYVLSGYRGAAGVALPVEGARGSLDDAKQVLWRINKGTPYVPSPLLWGNRLYFTQTNQNLLTILDVKTGKALLDRERLPGIDSFYASPMGASDRIYFVDRNGTTLVLRRGDKLDILATNRLDDPIDASPAAVGKQLFLRGEKYLYCIEAK
jgi:outer membrane protein assembly factor BamB